jgi:hypothetical protein
MPLPSRPCARPCGGARPRLRKSRARLKPRAFGPRWSPVSWR